MDRVPPDVRSRMMSRIRGKDTRPEIDLRLRLFRMGFRYRLHSRKLPGRPDLAFPKFRAAILVHGCFWHRHANCAFATTPASNEQFWQEKFQSNVDRDARNVKALKDMGWRVLTVWECELDSRHADSTAHSVAAWLRQA